MLCAAEKFNFCRECADYTDMEMSFSELSGLLKAVVLSPEVIGTTVVLLLFLNLVFYTVSYRKRAGGKKKRRKGISRASSASGGSASVPDHDGEGHGSVSDGGDDSIL